MQLNPYIARFLEAHEPEQLTLLVDWIEPITGNLQEEPQFLIEEPDMKPTLSLVQNNNIALNDLIEFSLINEFGPNFGSNTCFKWLNHCVSRQISRRFTTETSGQ